VTDASFVCPSLLAADAAAGQGTEVWVYRYDFGGLRLISKGGAMHGTDVPLMFASWDRRPYSLFFGGAARGARAEKQSPVIRAYWTAFAHPGTPEGAGRAAWPKYRREAPWATVFDDVPGGEALRVADRCAFWDGRSVDMGW
jgi:para-nitrobenzyl esterase